MKKIIQSLFFVFGIGFASNLFAQLPPPVSDSVNLRDENIRMRSMDMERTKRDDNKSKNADSEAVTTAAVNTEIDKKYPQIKEDFESIQNNQAAIVKAYTSGKEIDYAQIKTSAEAINKSAKRLDENLFAPDAEEKKSKEKGNKKSKDVKELIVELDNSIGSFISSAMFQNLRVVDPEVAGKTRADLMKVTEISNRLSKEAEKVK